MSSKKVKARWCFSLLKPKEINFYKFTQQFGYGKLGNQYSQFLEQRSSCLHSGNEQHNVYSDYTKMYIHVSCDKVS